ncbi:MAG: DUF5801 repeats-in-toxin domain-containing protein [Alphaproteobacteria bacterium]
MSDSVVDPKQSSSQSSDGGSPDQNLSYSEEPCAVSADMLDEGAVVVPEGELLDDVVQSDALNVPAQPSEISEEDGLAGQEAGGEELGAVLEVPVVDLPLVEEEEEDSADERIYEEAKVEDDMVSETEEDSQSQSWLNAGNVANIEPAAGGDTGGADGVSSGRGYGFQSGFQAQDVISLEDVGPINPTALVYGIPDTEDRLFIVEDSAGRDPVDFSFSPFLKVGDSFVKEDGSVDIFISAKLGTSDGSGSLVVTVSGVPASWSPVGAGWNPVFGETDQWELSVAAGSDYDGVLNVSPPADSDVDLGGITVEVAETSNGVTETVSQEISVFVDAVADTPDLTAQDASGEEGTAIDLDITTSVTDVDGSEVIEHVKISNLPAGATLSAGTETGGVWVVDVADLPTLQINVPDGVTGDFILNVESVAYEQNTNGLENDLTDNRASAFDTIALKVKADDVPVLGSTTLVVDESDLSPVDVDGDTISSDFGADGPGSFAPSGAASVSFTGAANGALTSGGVPVDVIVDGNKYVGIAGGVDVVFELTIDPNNGAHEFTLFGTLDHADETDPDDVIALEFGITATDSEGDAASSTITVNVKDDAPVAYDDNASVTNNSISGNVLANDDGGEDDPALVTEVRIGGVTETLNAGDTVTIAGTYGTLEIYSSGVYTYTATGGVDGVDQFTYKLTDNDGDSAQADLTIDVSVDDKPQIATPRTLGVDDTDIADSDNSVINVDYGNDGPGVVSGTGTYDLFGLTSEGEPVVVSFDAATNIYTGTAHGDTIFTLLIGEDGAYKFDLLGTVDHPVAGSDAAAYNDDVQIEFGFQAADVDGDSVPGVIKVDIFDDGLTANDDVNTYDTTLGSATGNVVTGVNGGAGAADDLSNDNPNTVIEVSYNGTTYAVPQAGSVSVNGQFGVLEIDAQGEYTYTLNSAVADPISFNETLEFPALSDADALSGDKLNNLGIADGVLDIGGPTNGTVKFVSEGAAYDNTLGAYTVAADGTIEPVSIVIPNGNDAAGTGTFNFSATSGEEIGFFIVADGYDVNNGYAGLDLDNGTIQFIYKYGSADERPANVNDNGADLSLVYSDGVSETVLDGAVYHSTERGGSNNLNADGSVRVVSGLAQAGDDTVLRIGFEDLPGLGDRDYEDMVFDLSLTPDCLVDAFTYTLQDGDGDTSSANLELIGKDLTDYVPVVSDETAKVDETDGVGTLVSGMLDVDYGRDDPGSISANGQYDVHGVTSNGVPVTVNYAPGTGTYMGMAGSEVVFVLQVFSNGQYDFVLSGTLDHPDGLDPDDVLMLDFGITATDADGDAQDAQIHVKIYDDGPVAHDDCEFFNASDVSYQGNVLDNDVLSQDVANNITQIGYGSNVEAVAGDGSDTRIDGAHGYLLINNEGEYSYTLYDSSLYTTKGTSVLNPESSDVTGIQSSITKDGITVVANSAGSATDLAWVITHDGDGLGIDNLTRNETKKAYGSDEYFDISFDDAADSVSITVGEIGDNNDDGHHGADLVITFADGTTQNVEVQFDPAGVNNGYFTFTVDHADYGSSLIQNVKLASVGAGQYRGASFLLNNVEATYGDAEPVSDEFTYTLTDRDGDVDTAVLKVTADPSDGSIIAGEGGDDVIMGTQDEDVLYGCAGADVFVFADLHDGVDTIRDFDIGEGDSIDLSSVLGGFDPMSDLLSDFVITTENGGDTQLYVDASGSGDFSAAVQIALIDGVTGLDVDQIVATETVV